MVKRTLAVMGMVLGLGAAATSPALSAALGTGLAGLNAPAASSVTQVQCWNCGWGGGWGGGAVVGFGVAPVMAAPVMVAPVVATPVVAPGVIFAVPQLVAVPPPILAPQFAVVAQPVVVPQVVAVPRAVAVAPVVAAPVLVPAACWHETDNRGYGFWGNCWGR